MPFTYADTHKALVSTGISEDMAGLFIEMIRAFNDGLLHTPRTPDNTTDIPLEEFAEIFVRLISK